MGLWVLAEGVVYPMWDERKHIRPTPTGDITKKIISVDYGVNNPAVFLMIGRHSPTGRLHVMKEFCHDSTKSEQWTDAQLADALVRFMTRDVMYVVCDPSATFFIVELRKRGVTVKEANNEVIAGIQEVNNLLHSDMLAVDPSCQHLKQEMGIYVWDSKAQIRGEDKPVKAHDHCEDCARYGVMEFKSASIPQISHSGPKENNTHMFRTTSRPGPGSRGRFSGW